MWSSVVLLALISALDPIKAGVTAVLVTRPRPLANLFMYWLGLMTVGLGGALIVLLFLPDLIYPVTEAVMAAVTHPVVPPLQIAFGVIAVPTAAVVAMRTWTRTPVLVGVAGADGPAVPLPDAAARRWWLPWSVLLNTKRGSSLGLAYAAGLCTSAPPLEACLMLLAIVASGAALGIQISAAVVFIVIAFTVAEIPLISFLVWPEKTQTVVTRLQGWVRQYRTRVIAIAVGVFGAVMFVYGVTAI